MSELKTNVLYYGDNLEVIHKYIPDNCVDLIYIDPPFFSSKAYEIIYGDAKEVRMFEDRWKGDVYHYVNWMEPRLAQMHRILKSTGTIYVHLDWHAVHYIKIVMDKILGYDNFLNEVIWHYRRWSGAAKRFQKMHDTILFYAKEAGKQKFNVLYTAYTPKSLARKQHYHTRIKGDDVYVTSISPKGVRENDVWIIPIINSQARERLGYPTQKPEALLKRIIEASSDPGDIVADFFCGCGTTLAVAQLLGRKWIGCDVSPTALKLVKQRLIKYGATNIEEVGVPKSMEDLKVMKPFEFQNYVISFIQGMQNPKLTGEGGIDGWTVFNRYPLQVKQQEHVGRPEIQKFQSAIRAEKKEKGYFFAFSFSKPAYEEVARCKQEENIEIELHEVQKLMTADPVPSFL
jgi:DNA modification methylase